jgi:hypothetical protein
MKVLLDENIDIRFKKLLTGHEVFTVKDMGWNGMKNGALLKLLFEHQFDCWIVVDKNIPYQQNATALPCLIVVLDVLINTLKHISSLIPFILSTLENEPGKKIIVLSEKNQQS